MKKSITSLLSLQNSTFAICPITGIPYTISFPSLGIDFNYYSPFTKINNLSRVASLSSVELKKLPKVTLAGITLAYLHYTKLLENSKNIPAFEANSYLQLIPSHCLISAIKFLSSLKESQYDILPHFSLLSIKEDTEFSTTTNLLENYLKACAEIINPTPATSVSVVDMDIPSLHEEKKEKKAKSLTLEDKKTIRHLCKTITEDSLCSVKLAAILNLLPDNNIIISLDENVRAKIISRLEPMATVHSIRLISFLNKYNPKLEADFMDRVSDDFAIVKAKKSLAEILAERKNKNV